MKTLETFDFGASTADRSSYDWDAILDGKVHVMVPGEDFTCKPITLKSRARAVAKNMELNVRTATDEDGNVVIQAYEKGEETEFDRKRQAAAKKLRDARVAKKAAAAETNGDEGEDDGDVEAPVATKPAPAKTPAAAASAAAPVAPRRRK